MTIPSNAGHVRAPAAHPVPVLDVDLVVARAEEEEALLVLRQLVPGPVEVDLVAVADRLDDGLVVARAPNGPGDERAFADRDGRIGHEQVRVDALLRAEAHAARAGPVRRVEAEDARLELREPDPVLGAGEALGEGHRLAVDDVDRDEPVGQGERGLDRVREAVAQIRLDREPVDHDLDRVLELLVQLDLLVEEPLLAVDLDAREALVPQVLEEVLVLALPVPDDRER